MKIVIQEHDGTEIDTAYNVESAVSVLYGDLSTHKGQPRHITCPAECVEQLREEARINADCYDLPVDIVVPDMAERCLQCEAKLEKHTNLVDYDARVLYERDVLEPGHKLKHFYSIGFQLFSIGYTNADGRYYQITCEYFAGKWIVS